MARKSYTSVENYLKTAHADLAWVYSIPSMAEHWPNYSAAMGEVALRDCEAQAFESAKRRDKAEGIEIVIDAGA